MVHVAVVVGSPLPRAGHGAVRSFAERNHDGRHDSGPATNSLQGSQVGQVAARTRADLEVGDVLTPGHASNFEDGRQSNYVYVTGTLDAAAWGGELARCDGPGRIYILEVDGELEDDPNLTDKRFPGNPTRSYGTREPVDHRRADRMDRASASVPS